VSDAQPREKFIVASAVQQNPWRCPGCGHRDLTVGGNLQREYRELVRDGKLTGEYQSGEQLVMEVETIHCLACNVKWILEPTDFATLRIENVDLKHQLAAVRGESYTAWF
jgi:hypothetical protein